MGLFSRKKKTTDDSAVPEEIRDYYEAEKRDRMWVVWLLSGATFLVTVLVVLGLFWAGRWAYREVTKKDQPATVTTEQGQQQTEQQGTQDQNQQQSGQSSDSTSGQQTAPPSQPTAPSNTSSTGTNTSSSTTQTPTTTPNTGPTTPELPNTGPTSDE